MSFMAEHLGILEPDTELNTFDSRDREESTAKLRGEAVSRFFESAKCGQEPVDHYAEGAAQALSELFRFIDARFHGFGRLFIGAAQLAHLDGQRSIVSRIAHRVFLDHTYAADGNDIGIDLHAHFSQEFTGDARSCNANSGLACARTLEDIATIGLIILEHTQKIGMSGARRDLAHKICWLITEYRHAVGPVLPVIVLDRKAHGASERFTEANARQDLNAVLLDLLPSSATVSALTPSEIGIDVLFRDRKPCRHSGNDSR